MYSVMMDARGLREPHGIKKSRCLRNGMGNVGQIPHEYSEMFSGWGAAWSISC